MKITKEMLEKEIKALQKASEIHAKYSILQYKEVLKTLEILEKEKVSLEKKVKERTKHLEKEIQEKEKLTLKLENLAKYDQLTGLANRYMFFNELEILYQEAKLLNNSFAILFIDLDGFKLVNDTYGHEAGDIVLQTISERMRKLVRKNDLISRLGGDEFTIILNNLDNVKKLKEIATKIIKEISKEILIDNNIKVYVGASIGIYIYDKQDTLSGIIAKADIAMYEAKKTGKGKFIFFNAKMKEELKNLTTLKHSLKNDINNKKLKNFFQPIISSIDLKIKGAEVLTRWDKASPDKFIPILEEDINLIKDFTFWQIEEVTKLLPKFNIFFSINISGKLLFDNDLLNFLINIIEKYKIDTSKIHFEVTETSLAININKASSILNKIKELGFVISLDDFGTGYSSLAYIKNLPIDILKIDREFLLNINSIKEQKILFAIISMAEILEMKIILEGIETKVQLKNIPKKRFIKYQGFLFYKPLSIEKFQKLLKTHFI